MQRNSLEYNFDNQDQLEDVLIEDSAPNSVKTNRNTNKFIFTLIELFLALLITMIIFKFSDEISTYFAYVIIFIAISIISLSTSLWAETGQLRTCSKQLGILSCFTSIFSIIAFLIWMK